MREDFNIEASGFFDAAHSLKDSQALVTKACCNLHGHTYKIKVQIHADVEDRNIRNGMLMDFGKIKQAWKVLDHAYVNEVFSKNSSYADKEPTAENIALFILDRIWQEIPDHLLSPLVCVHLWEGWKGDDSNKITVAK